MKRTSGNQGNGSFDGMRGNPNDVNDSHRALTELVGAARDTFGDDLSARQQAGLVRFEQAVARRTLRSSAARGWAFGFGLVAAGAAAAVVMFHRQNETLTFAVGLSPGSDTVFAQAEDSFGVFGDPVPLGLTVV